VAAVNDALAERPELINAKPNESGWLFDVNVSNGAEPLKDLSSADQYRELIGRS
jgi:glycine cleavage system H lipoate-binding protein